MCGGVEISQSPEPQGRSRWLDCRRSPLTEVSEQHLAAVALQLLRAWSVAEPVRWVPIVSLLAMEAAAYVSPAGLIACGNIDPRFYIKAGSQPFSTHFFFQHAKFWATLI